MPRLPLDCYTGYTGCVVAVTAADVKRAAGCYVDPERVAIVILGDRENIEPGVRALGLGPVATLTIENVLGPVPVVQAVGN